MPSIRSHVASVGLVLGLGALALACGKSTGAASSSTTTTTSASITIAASCDAISVMSTCMDYETESAAREDCPSFGGKVSTSPCTAAGLSGSCAIEGKGIRRYYSTGPMPNTTDYASGHCVNSMAGTFTAPPAGAAAAPAAAAAPGAAPAAGGAATPVSPDMTQFMSELDGTSKKVGAALKKHGIKGLKTDDMGMWNLEQPKVTASEVRGKNTCYTMDAASGMTTRTYELCWANGKIVSVKDEGMK
jgi:hypothetical protein